MINSTKTEDRVRKRICSFIESHQPLTLTIEGLVLQNVVGCYKPNKRAKADFVILYCGGMEFYISHKASGFTRAGYGSLGSKAFASKSPYQEQSIWDFVVSCYQKLRADHYCTGTTPPVLNWNPECRGFWCFPPPRIQNLIVYGPEFGKGSSSLMNCHVAAVGEPHFMPKGDHVWEFAFDHQTKNGAVPSGDNEPFICVGGPVGTSQSKAVL